MKWFRNQLGANMPAQQLTRDAAMLHYRDATWGNMQLGSLTAVENMIKGKMVHTMHHTIWGEDISDKELFRRVLKGEVVPPKGREE